jgi:hypothetical protein
VGTGYKEQEQNPVTTKQKGKPRRTRIKAFPRMKKGFDKCYQYHSKANDNCYHFHENDKFYHSLEIDNCYQYHENDK